MLFSRLNNRKLCGIVILALLLASIFVAAVKLRPVSAAWWDYSWLYRKSITIDHTKVAGDLSNFPVLIDVTDADLATEAQSNGNDIAFADLDGNRLDHEIELYNSGHLTAWVRLPSLSSTSDTVFYMYYGNPSASDQQNRVGVWDSGFRMVQHLKEASGTCYDSTVNGNDGTPYGGVSQGVSGKINSAASFDGLDDSINAGSATSIDNLHQTTLSAWIRMNTVGGHVYDKGWTSGKSFYVHPTGLLCFVQGFTSGSPNPYGWWKTSVTLNAGTWYFVSATYDDTSSTNDPRLYLNGVSVSVTEGNVPMGTALSDAGFEGRIGGNVTYTNGIIDEVRISSGMRSDAWISTEYNNQFNPSIFYSIGSEEIGTMPEAPSITNVTPSDGAANVGLNPTLSVHATDFQGDLMTIIFSSNASEAWVELGRYTNVENGTYNQTTSNMNSYNTTYYWKVCATDGLHWTNSTYSFATRPKPPAWWDYSWLYRKSITIDHTKVAGDLSNFPVLIDVTDADLASKARSDGADIAFADLTGHKLDHEIELYSNASGHLTAWVRLSTVSASVDTVFYMYYGNPSASDQQNRVGVWDSGFRMVQHLKEASGTCYDSTVNGNDGTPYGGVSQGVSGKIDGAAGFDGTNGTCIDVGSGSSIDNIKSITITAWIKVNSWPSYIFDKGFVGGKGFYVHDNGYLSFVHGFSTQYGWWRTSTATVSVGSWHYVAVTYDNANVGNDPTLYIDGVSIPITEGRTPDGATSSDSGYEGFISCNQTELGSRTMNGTTDELRLVGTIRSPSWILTEYNSQLSPSTFHNLGSEETATLPRAPWLTDEDPRDGTMDVPLNPTLSIHAVDFQGDLMTIIFSTNSTGSWSEIGRYTSVGNGTYTQSTSDMNSYSTTYGWKVCATDGTDWENNTYSFSTRPENFPPSLSNPSPEDGATGICLSPVLSIDANDPDGDSMTLVFCTNITGTWQVVGTQSGKDGRYSQPVSGSGVFETCYGWEVDVTDGKTWTNRTFTFTTWMYEDLYKQIGYYWCAGMPYAGESTDKNKFYAIWFSLENTYPWPPTGDCVLYYSEFDREIGWVNGTVMYSNWLCDWGGASSGTRGCPHFGYFGGKYHIFWGTPEGYFYHLEATEWSDFQAMTSGWQQFGDYLGDIEPWGSVYAFNDSYAINFFGKDYSVEGHTIVYWTWNEASGWSDMIPLWNTSTGGHEHYPHDASGPVLLPINRTTWYLYYKSNIGGDHFDIMKSFDAGQTWTAPQIADLPEQPYWRSHRPAFVRYGDNFYMVVNIGGTQLACYNSSDGLHWGNKQIIYSGDWYVPQGVMLDQSHILWTASKIGYLPGAGITGEEFGGVFEIPRMMANPEEPSDPYPSNGRVLSQGTTHTSLQVKVHGTQTYDVAFYWANGTFIGEDKMLKEGEIASFDVSGLRNGETYEWYAIARGTTYGYWGNEPDTTSDEKRSDAYTFGVGITPGLEMSSTLATCHKQHENLTVQVNVTKVTNLHDFAFEIHYNATLLDYVDLTWGTFLDGSKVVDSINETTGVIQGHIGPSTPVSGAGWLLNITFQANQTLIWKDYSGWVNKLEGKVWFYWAELSLSGGTSMRYEEWPGGRQEISVNQLNYTFIPLQGDLDNDGDVDIYDLRTVAYYYNVKEGNPRWESASTYDLNGDRIIDIFDLVITAVKYGTVYDC